MFELVMLLLGWSKDSGHWGSTCFPLAGCDQTPSLESCGQQHSSTAVKNSFFGQKSTSAAVLVADSVFRFATLMFEAFLPKMPGRECYSKLAAASTLH